MTARFGAYGKISGLGDFLRLDLPGEFVRAWDDWLQAGLLAVREALGAEWDAHYLSAPIWRFSLPAGVFGGQGVSGILMASVDRVGRQYPLTIAARCPPGNTALRHFASGAVFAKIEEIALATLDDGTGREELKAALAAVEFVPPADPGDPGATYAGPVAPEHVIAAHALTRAHGEVGIWTTQVEGDHRMMLTRGLPGPRQVTALFDLDASLWQSGPVTQPA